MGKPRDIYTLYSIYQIHRALNALLLQINSSNQPFSYERLYRTWSPLGSVTHVI